MSAGTSATRQDGVLTDWNDDRGFGFITPVAGGSRLFVHISAFPRGRRPIDGCEVTYCEILDERNRLQASGVRYLTEAPTRKTGGSGTSRALVTSALFFALVAVLVLLEELPAALLAAYVVLSGVAFLMYRADKSAARQNKWRTPESRLHLISLLGGWPGALVARHRFRHKTSKQPFRRIFWATVIVNCSALAWFVHEAPVVLP